MDEIGACAPNPDRPPLWRSPDHIYRRQHFLPKIFAESFDARFVEILGREKLGLGCGVKEYWLHDRRRGRRANTLLAGILAPALHESVERGG